MSKPVSKFWDNIECALDESAFRYILDEMIRDTRSTLPDSSPTAQSIDRKDPLHDMACCAYNEGLDDFARALDFAFQE